MCPPRTTTCPRQPPPPPAPAARTRGPSIESSGHQDPPQEVENFHTDFTITEKASTEAFYVIMNFQTSRRFVSSSNPPLSSPALILRTRSSPSAGHRTAPECCRLLQSSCRSCTSPLQRAAVTGCSAAVPHLTCRTPELAVVVF